jgi:parallel beta-helix repeat protein
MRVERLSVIVALLVLTSTFYLALTILPVNVKAATLYVGGTGPDNYSKIQLAIDDANPGDTIYVYSGTYNEDVGVYKPLTLIGENRGTTIIRGTGSADTVVVTTDGVTITGFTAENSGSLFGASGIRLLVVQNCHVTNNIVTNNVRGISVSESYNNTVRDNIVSNSENGIYVENSAYNRIADNTAFNNAAGIYLKRANNNTITGNTLFDNGYGIILLDSSYAVLDDNVMTGNGIFIDGGSRGFWNTHSIDTSNSVNGEPVQYWKNVTGGTVPLNAGQVILANSSNVLVDNQNVSSASIGIEVGFSSHITITDNTALSNYHAGIHVYISDNITVTGNNASNNEYIGISIVRSITNIITDNTASSNRRNGIYCYDCDINTITRNNIFLTGDSFVGRIEYSAVYLRYSDYSVVTENSVLSNSNAAFSLLSSNFNNIFNNNFSHNGNGVFFVGASSNRFVNNTVFDNTVVGISLGADSSHNIFADNNVTRHWYGIGLGLSHDNTLIGNYVSSYDTMYGRSGIIISGSTSHILIDNVMVGDGLVIDGGSLQTWNTHIIPTSNTVNGRPVRYWKNVTGGTVPLDASEVILANCTDVTVENQDLTNGTAGIELGFSSNNMIAGNSVSKSKRGIHLVRSDNNTIVGNTVSSPNFRGIFLGRSHNNTLSDNDMWSGVYGIFLGGSDGNNVTDNNIWDNSYAGIFLWRALFYSGSQNNTITNNSIFNNGYGIGLLEGPINNTVAYNTIVNNLYGVYISLSTDNNQIHHNNIIDNTQQAYDDLDTNQWDDGYPSGGNYWSDYTGVDSKSGPNQDLPGSDGKGDTPYVIDADSKDRYPLMTPLATSPPSAPLNLSATAGDQQITLSWKVPSFDGGLPITNYRIYRGTIPGGEVFLTEVGNVLTYPDTGLTNGQLYCYKVSAVNGIGEGPLSNEACATPTSVPGAPIILQADLSGKDLENVTLTWSLSSDDGAGQNSVVSYVVLRGTTYDSNGFGYVPHAFVPNGTSEFVDNLAGEGDPNNYFYQVCAVDLNSLANCSANQGGKFTRPLSEGPNLISIPLVQSNDGVETVLQTVEWDKAWSYNSSQQRWKWSMKFKPYPGELARVDLSMGLWVNVTQESNLTLAGIVPSSTAISLHDGWNLVGFPSFQQDYTVGDLKVSVGAERVEGFDALVPPYFLKLLMDGDTLQTGFGYWVKTTGETTWIVANS